MFNLLTDKFHVHTINQLRESITEAANTAYYVFLANHVPGPNSQLQEVNTSIKSVFIDTRRNMIQGKRISANDVSICIRAVPYSAKVFDMYDDEDLELDGKDYFCYVDEGSYFHVYKCLDNNNGANSTVEPEFAHITGSNTEIYQTSDGYRWKYMYSVSSAQKLKFATANVFPVIANSTVANSAVAGAIDIIKVDSAGRRYDNYTWGTFSGEDINIDGNPTIFKISNNTISQVNGFLTGCILYISSGTGVGQHKTITDYITNANGKFITLEEAFDTIPTNGSQYQIYPQVQITGDGVQTINAVGRALVNALASNSIYRIEMLERGEGYSFAVANVIANSMVGISNAAVVRCINGPISGHGSNPEEELGKTFLNFSVSFSNSEANTLLTSNEFGRIGLIKDPLFSNVVIETSSIQGAFNNNEQIYKFESIPIVSGVTANSQNTTLVCATANFSKQLAPGQKIYLTDNLGNNQLATVNSIVNSSYITLTSNAFFSSTNADINQVNLTSSAFFTDYVDTDIVQLANVSGVFSTNDLFIGVTSGAVAQVNVISRNDVIKGFDTFINLHKYKGTITQGVFIPNEVVFQGNLTTANASLHSVVSNSGFVDIYTSNQIGVFQTSNTISGNSSLAAASITNKYLPELVFGSGDILYVENITPITRQNNQSENIKLILSCSEQEN